jgi:hypothetical protein
MVEAPRVLNRPMALRAGLSDEAIAHRLARHSWTRLHSGVYFTRGPEPTYPDVLAGALLAAGPRSVLSGAAALSLWEVRGVLAPRRPLVLVPHNTGSTAYRDLQIRATPIPYRAVVVRGLRTAGAARALTDHCIGIPRLSDVQSAVSEVVRRQLCTAAELQASYRKGPRRGSANLRIAIEDAMLGAWSVPEARLGRGLRAAGVAPFTQNTAIHDRSGRLLGIVDMWWQHLNAAVEVQGAEHHSSPADWAQSLTRVASLQENGIAVLQIPAVEVLRHLDAAVARIGRWLDAVALRSRGTARMILSFSVPWHGKAQDHRRLWRSRST